MKQQQEEAMSKLKAGGRETGQDEQDWLRAEQEILKPEGR